MTVITKPSPDAKSPSLMTAFAKNFPLSQTSGPVAALPDNPSDSVKWHMPEG